MIGKRRQSQFIRLAAGCLLSLVLYETIKLTTELLNLNTQKGS